MNIAMKTTWTFVWHFLVVLSLLALIAAGIGFSQGMDFYLEEPRTAYRLGDEGPHVFLQDGQWLAHTLRGNRDEGFRIEEQRHAASDSFPLEVIFPLDQSRFSMQVAPEFVTPPIRYRDDGPVLAISDIEGGYRTFRDFLIRAGVIDAELNWTFGNGHLVLLGDFVDRGPSVTQVLWLIYKLEQSARTSGGHVHYILGNHEIKNLQGDFHATHKKYFNVAAILGRQQSELFGNEAFLGRWLASKNIAEVINGTLFVHGGLHPALADQPWSLEEINRIVRAHYRRIWYPGMAAGNLDLLLNTRTGPSWYRGYFKDEISQAQLEATLAKFDATVVVVGHTLNWRVKSLFNGKVFAIDVKHPLDYRTGFPLRRSEGLWLEDGKAWRVLDDGRRQGL